MASAGPYANHLHLAPGRQPCHASTSPLSSYRPDALPPAQPTASNHWRQIHRQWSEVLISSGKSSPKEVGYKQFWMYPLHWKTSPHKTCEMYTQCASTVLPRGLFRHQGNVATVGRWCRQSFTFCCQNSWCSRTKIILISFFWPSYSRKNISIFGASVKGWK